MNRNDNNVPVWHINGLALPFDFDDLESMKRYEEALKEMSRQSDRQYQSHTEFIEIYCNSFYQFYDNLFGQGTGNRIFDGRKNCRYCDDVYESFLSFVKVSRARSDQKRKNMYQKYLGKPQDHRKSGRKQNHAKHSHRKLS